MPIYEYVCPDHGPFDSMARGDQIRHDCGLLSRRIFTWRNASVLMDHYNPAFGRVIHSRAQASELAKRASDEQSARLGMTVDYELTDAHDHEAAGIDKAEATELLDQTKAVRGW